MADLPLTAYGRRWPETERTLHELARERAARSMPRNTLLVQYAHAYAYQACANKGHEAAILWAQHELACALYRLHVGCR